MDVFFHEGDPVGEPSLFLLLDSMRVLHEKLVIDMQPWEFHEPVRIVATYRLFNAGRGKQVDFLLVAGSLRDSGMFPSVSLNDSLIPGKSFQGDSLHVPWIFPDSTPGFSGADLLYYVFRDSTVLFSPWIKEGENIMTIEYPVLPGRTIDPPSTLYHWQIAYVLSPARRWAGFDSLDVEVLVPEGWEARIEPRMEVEGNRLHGSWSGLPANEIGITARLHLNWIQRQIVQGESQVMIGGMVFVILLPLFLGIRAGRRLAYRGETAGKGLGSLGLSIFFVDLIPYVTILLYWGIQSLILGDQALPSYYDFLYLFILVPCILVGVILGQIAFFITRAVVARLLRKRNERETKDFH